MAGPNWAKLYKEGRVKAVGVPWNEEEAYAVGPLGIPAEYVRSGILTVEAYEKAKAEDEKKGTDLSRMSTRELVDKASALGLDLPPQTTDSEYRYQILATEGKKEVKKPTKKVEKKKPTKKKK